MSLSDDISTIVGIGVTGGVALSVIDMVDRQTNPKRERKSKSRKKKDPFSFGDFY